MNVVAIIQARTGSSRLPNKIFSKLNGFDLLYHIINRLKPSIEINKIVVATTNSVNDNSVEDWCIENFVDFYRGSEKHVLKRYYNAAIKFRADIIIRVTADDPFKDFRIIDKAIKIIKENKYDFVCNNSPVSFPEGLDVEVLTMNALTDSFINSISSFEQEHVTQYIHRNKQKFKIFNIKNDKNLSHFRWTIDTMEDYLFVKEVYDNLYKKNNLFLTEDIYELLKKKPLLLKINSKVKKSDLYK
jgi:spore coat polysaccharide biosynthesis protein SpsF